MSRFLHWLTIFSDAAKEGTLRPGLGGWIKGYYWFISLKCPYTESLLDIHKDGDVPKHPSPKVQFIGSRDRPKLSTSCKSM